MTAIRRELFGHFKSVIYTAITRARYAVVCYGSVSAMALIRALIAENGDVLKFESNGSGSNRLHES